MLNYIGEFLAIVISVMLRLVLELHRLSLTDIARTLHMLQVTVCKLDRRTILSEALL